jgi:hypothetical protein
MRGGCLLGAFSLCRSPRRGAGPVALPPLPSRARRIILEQSLSLVVYPRNLIVITQEYRTNRARFPQSALVKYQGSWVAFSANGCRIVASGETVEQVEERLAAAGEDAQAVVLEWVAGAEDDSLLGGGELM